MKRSVVLIGATGLVGSECLRLLQADPSVDPVRVVARREPPAGVTGRSVDWRVGDLERLDRRPEWLAADVVICALGTTIRQAGSQERFREVDFGIPLAAGRVALAQGARHYVLVSALGADARSRVFYNRVKGELEDAVTALGFPGVTILRPSLLLGDRPEFRLGEEIAKRIAFMVPGKYRPIHARSVATAAVRAAKEDRPGVRVVESAEMHLWMERGAQA